MWSSARAWTLVAGTAVLIGAAANWPKAVSAIEPFLPASKPYVIEQGTQTAHQIVTALGPRMDVLSDRLDMLSDKLDGQTDKVIQNTITSSASSIVTLNAQIDALAPLLADFPHNIALIQKDQDLRAQLARMQRARDAAVCEMNQRRTPGFVCPGN